MTAVLRSLPRVSGPRRLRLAPLWTILALVLTATGVVAQTLVKDIHPGTTPGGLLFPTKPVVFGSAIYTVDEFGMLWRSDGAAAGSVPLRALPTPRAEMVVAGSTLFALTSGSGIESVGLWRSDGTAAGTVEVRSFNRAYHLHAHQDRVFFSASDDTDGTDLEPWTSDGTLAGTTRVADVRPGAAGSVPTQFTSLRDWVYFVADDGANGRELWRTQGAAASTQLVRDIRPGPTGSQPNELTAFGGLLCFCANDGQHGAELWVSVGTLTVMVRDVDPGSASSTPRDLVVAGDSLFFSAYHSSTGRELWKSRGTFATTVLVKDIDPGGFGGRPNSSSPSHLLAVGNRVFFGADDPVVDRELFVSDGTAAGTVLAADVDAGPGRSSRPRPIAASAGRLLFNAMDGPVGQRREGLWSLDLSSLRFGFVQTVRPWAYELTAPWPGNVTVWNDTVFFAGEPTTHEDVAELWRSDGTAAGTRVVLDPAPPAGISSHPTHLTPFQDRLFFVARDPDHGSELWSSDGTRDGTQLFLDLRTGPADSRIGSVTVADGRKLYFAADDGQNGRELWVSDGTRANTNTVLDIGPGAADGVLTLAQSPGASTVALIADDGQHGRELWWSNGTPRGTYMVKDIGPGSAHGVNLVFLQVEPMHEAVYFAADDGASGLELWRSDGTENGTWRVADIARGTDGSVPHFMTVVGSTLYFVAHTPSIGQELWATDGTAAGTRRIADIATGLDSSRPRLLTAVGSLLYFTADDGVHGRELWITDGTTTGTRMLADLAPGDLSSDPRALTGSYDSLFFTAFDPVRGRELYRARGETVTLVRDLATGPESGAFWTGVGPLGSNARALFAGQRGDAGYELWRTDGTDSGTELVDDIAPGPWRSTPTSFTRVGRTIFFTAWQPGTGTELHSIDLAAAGGVLSEPYGNASVASDGSRAGLGTNGRFPTIGNAGFEIRIRRTLPDAAALLMVSHARAELPIGPGICRLYVQLPAIELHTTTTSGGGARVPLPVPDDPALRGVELFVQAAVLDTGGCFANAVSLSRARHLMIND